jgi:hypothetical protein
MTGLYRTPVRFVKCFGQTFCMSDDDARAYEILERLHDEQGCGEAPIEEMRAALQRLLPALDIDNPAHRYLVQTAELEVGDLDYISDDDDAVVEVWLAALSALAVAYPATDVSPSPADVLVHLDWIAIFMGLPDVEDGEPVGAADLLRWVEVRGARRDGPGADDADALRAALSLVVRIWTELGGRPSRGGGGAARLRGAGRAQWRWP